MKVSNYSILFMYFLFNQFFIAKTPSWGTIIKAFGSDEQGKKAGEAACRAIGKDILHINIYTYDN